MNFIPNIKSFYTLIFHIYIVSVSAKLSESTLIKRVTFSVLLVKINGFLIMTTLRTR